jgi:hypothetical protein
MSGLRRLCASESIDIHGVRSSIEIRLSMSTRFAYRRVDALTGRALRVTALGLGGDRAIRIYFEASDPIQIWAIGPQSGSPTE